uniref:CSON009395 protein n=1 Tax=Culicoides sonorensis TaxID=179676 RepID=A0A336LZX9_CULSO
MLFLLVSVIGIIPLFLLWNYLKWEAEDKKLGISGPKSTLILGNIPDLWQDIQSKTVFQKAAKFCDTYGDTYRLRIGSKLMILTRDVKIIEGIIHNPKFVKSDDYRFTEKWLGNGLIRSSGERWHKFRKLITPAFHFQILERFVVIFEEQTDVLVQNIMELCENRVIDVVPMFHAFALDVISDNKFLNATQELLHFMGMRFFSLLHSKDWFWYLSDSGKKEAEQISYIHRFVDQIINNRRSELLTQKGDGLAENQIGSGKVRPVLLDILLQSEVDGKPLNNEDIRAEVNTFMFAGHETTGTTLGFLFYVLAKYPEVQTRVWNEIQKLKLHKENNLLSMKAINGLNYAENVIRETLRLYPILSAHEVPELLFKQYGDTYRVRIGPNLLIFTRDVKIIESIVNNPKFVKSDDYKLYEPWLGNGIVLASGERWHKMRKLLTPAFHFQILERFIPIYQDQGKIFLRKIRELNENESINIVPWFHSFALDVIMESSIGVKLGAQSDPTSKFVKANKDLLDKIALRFYYPLYRFNFIWKLSSHYKRVSNCISYINEIVSKVINERRSNILNETSEKLEKQRPALLDILLQGTIDDKPLSNETICDEMKTFMMAGHETTGTTLSFITYMLAKYPHVQDEIYSELIKNYLDDCDKPLTIRDINSLAYLDCVIKETLRLFPILPDGFKQCGEDVKFGEYFVPANTPIVTCIIGLHSYEKYFENPDEFNPERWKDEMSAEKRNPYAYQPFSAGLRNCIGQKFAMLEMKTLLIEILREYVIELSPKDFEMKLRSTTLLYPGNGVQVKFKKRQELE